MAQQKQFGWGKRCDRCGKGFQNIMNLSHSHIRTKHKSMPNLHKITLTIGGASRQFRFCTKCLRIMKEAFSASYKEAVTLVKEAQAAPPAVQTPEQIVETVAETVNSSAVEEEAATEEKETRKKSKKAPKVKTKKESSRKKSLIELVDDEEV